MITGYKAVERSIQRCLAAACTRLSAHAPDGYRRYTAGVRGANDATGFEGLEVHELWIVLDKNTHREDTRSKSASFFEKHRVPARLTADFRYAEAMRHRYQHDSAEEDATSAEKFADLVVIQRAMRGVVNAAGNCQYSAAAAAEIQRQIEFLVEEAIRGLLPDQYSEAEEEPNISDLRATVADQSTLAALDLTRADLAAVRTELSRLSSTIVQLSETIAESAVANVSEVGGRTHTVGTTDDVSSNNLFEDEGDNSTSLTTTPENTGVSELGELDRISSLSTEDPVELTPPSLSEYEARDRLMRLRAKIRDEYGEAARTDGILRKAMLNMFLHYRPTTMKELRSTPIAHALPAIPKHHLDYLDEIFAVLSRVQ